MMSISDEADAGADLKRGRRRKADTSAARVDRLPPHSPEAEQGCLGSALLAPKEVMPYLMSYFRAGDEVFFDLRHQTIYAHMVQMSNSADVIDLITLQQRLKDFGLLEEIGGIPYLSAIQDAALSPANVSAYAEIVLEKYTIRKGIQIVTEFVGNAYTHEGDVEELIDGLERDVLGIRKDSIVTESSGMKEMVPEAMQQIEYWFEHLGTLTGLPTGFADLDRMTCGLQKGELIVIAARPSLGKTTLLCNIFEHLGIIEKIQVGIFSFEMTKQALTTRMICSQARVNLRHIRDGFMSERDVLRLTMAAGKLQTAPIRIDDSSGMSIMQLKARARKMVQEHAVKAIGVDYLQLLHSTTKQARDNRQREVAEISGGLKELAKELNLPVIVLAQLNRDVERDKKRKPRLSDLRESGAIEADADVVGLLYKPSGDEEDDSHEEPDGVPTKLLIAKQRNGPTGDVNLTFLKPYSRFESAAKVSDEDVPQDELPRQPHNDA